MGREIVSNRAGDHNRMQFLIFIGIFISLITCTIGRNILTENYEENNSTNFGEEPLENNCNCEWRYYKHYETKGCQVVQVDSCGCPKKFLCPLTSSTNEETKICIYQNQEYKVGSRLNITNKCQFCRCLAVEDQPQIVCRRKECPHLEYEGDKNCHLVYEKDHCCPSKYECVLDTNENEATGEDYFCVHEGTTYPVGAKIYPSDDPCMICDCTENWRGVSNTSCHQQNCMFEKNKLRLQRGCIPVYHENKCCPIEFYCPDEIADGGIVPKTLIAESPDFQGDTCVFGNKSSEIGEELPMENPCIKCTCLVPPDFTCVHQSCPSPPSSGNCQAYFSSNFCCPSYDCSINDVSETNGTNDLEDECPTPQCADATCVIKIPIGHICPTCVCNESVSHEKNMFETTGEIQMEGAVKNDTAEIETLDSENENFEAEVLIPIESGSSNNKSEKFVEPSGTFVDDLDNDEREHLAWENDENVIIFEKESETIEDKEELLSNQNEPSDHIELEMFPRTSFNNSEDEESELETYQESKSESEAIENKEEILSNQNENPEHIKLEMFPRTSFNNSEDEESELENYQKNKPVSEPNEDNEELLSNPNEQLEHIELEMFSPSSFNITEDEESELEIHRRKRSVLGQHIALQPQGSNQVAQNSQQQFFEEEEEQPGSNREISEDNDEGFDELKFSNMNRKNREDGDSSDEDLISSESLIVPDGCPTPLCANSSCKIEIPAGQRCPACICKNREVWQP